MLPNRRPVRELTKATNLVNYLRLDVASSQDEVQKALKDRHTYLESVQDLPQYRKEAAMFMKHFATFTVAQNTR